MKCLYCGAEFPDNLKRKQVYCSSKCRQKYNYQNNKGKIDDRYVPTSHRICGICGKTFMPDNLILYCGKECQKVAKRNSSRESGRRMRARIPKKELKKRGPVPGQMIEKTSKIIKKKELGTCVVCGIEYEKRQNHQICCSKACKIRRKNATHRKSIKEITQKRDDTHNSCHTAGTGVVIKQAKPLPEHIFAKCDLCGKEYVKSVKSNGRCPVCRGIYHVQRVKWDHNRMEIL